MEIEVLRFCLLPLSSYGQGDFRIIRAVWVMRFVRVIRVIKVIRVIRITRAISFARVIT